MLGPGLSVAGRPLKEAESFSGYGDPPLPVSCPPGHRVYTSVSSAQDFIPLLTFPRKVPPFLSVLLLFHYGHY